MTNNRLPLIDALRGAALLGIILINVHAFMGLPPTSYFGLFDSNTAQWDKLTTGILAFAVHGKFYPIFSFCFGFGIAVQARQLRMVGLDAKAVLNKRFKFLLGLGLIHGFLVWPGDVLSTYAVAGFILRNHSNSSLTRLLSLLKTSVFLTLVVLTLLIVAIKLSSADARLDLVSQREYLSIRQIYLTGSLWAITTVKTGEFVSLFFTGLLILPVYCFLITLGLIAGRYARLIKAKQIELLWQHVSRWLYPLAIGTAIANKEFALLAAQSNNSGNLEWWLIGTIANPIISACYVLLFTRWALANPKARLLSWLAAVGQLSLSNYLLQSIILCLLLHPYGLGLGGKFQQFGLTGLAVAVYLVLAIVSVQYQRLGRAGPFESLWRRYKKA
jgi:uncharacterized protein